MKKAHAWLGIGLVCFGVLCATNVSSAETKVDVKSLDIYTVQPRLVTEEFMPPSTLQGVVQSLVDKFDHKLSYTDEYEYKDIITTGAVKKFGRDQIILWRGHGSWDETNERPIILTGRDFDEAEAEENVIVKDGYYEAITAEYINKYVGDLSGSLIYLNVCESAHNSEIVDMFLAKGAETVIGSTDTAEMTYSNNVQDMVVTLMGKINSETNDYYTIGEALTTAKKQYGEIDPGSKGEIVIFGNLSYRVATVEEVGPLAPNTGFLTKNNVK